MCTQVNPSVVVFFMPLSLIDDEPLSRIVGWGSICQPPSLASDDRGDVDRGAMSLPSRHWSWHDDAAESY
jgi:hypothetical protein